MCSISMKEIILEILNHNIIDGLDFQSCYISNQDFSGKHFINCENLGTIDEVNFNGAKFTNIDFTGADITNCSVKKVIFSECKFDNTRFSRVNLSGSNLSGTKLNTYKKISLKDVNLIETDLTGAIFTGVEFNSVNFTRAICKSTIFSKSVFRFSKFIDAILEDAVFIEANVEKVDFTNAILTGANFTKANLEFGSFDNADVRGVNFTKANLKLSYFENADVRGVNFTDANLSNIYFVKLDLSKAILGGAKLCQANLTEAILKNVNLINANLKDADLNKANLSGANLTDANLRGANLTDANLRGANLTGADLSDALLTNSIITDVKSSGQEELSEKIKGDKKKILLDSIILNRTNQRHENVPENSGYSNVGYNPVTKEIQDVNEWLEDKSNVVFIIGDDKRPMCFIREYFVNNSQSNYFLHLCDNDGYIKNKIKDETFFIDLSKYNLSGNLVIDFELFREMIIYGSKQVFRIIKIDTHPIELYNEDDISNINQCTKILLEYSDRFFKDITGHLLNKTPASTEVDNYIGSLDKCFIDYGNIADENMIVYRGMKAPYPLEIGQSMIIDNYISTSTNINVSEYFQNKNYYSNKSHIKPAILPENINNCCTYEIKVEKGIPFINMKHVTHYTDEEEILFPRNLIITFVDEYLSPDQMHIRKMTLSKATEGQFDIIKKKLCGEFYQANIFNANIVFSDEIKRSTRKKRKNTSKKISRTRLSKKNKK
jgi:uncharacterized protein YjbI with pentapeptide repeats